MKKIVFTFLLVMMTMLSSQAQFYGVDTEKLDGLLMGLSKLPPDNAKMILSSTLGALAKDPKAYRKAAETIERMGNPVDSMHNEILYNYGLETLMKSYVLSNSELERVKLLHDYAKRNAVGEKAADISYFTPDGATHHLCEQGVAYTLVFFNGESCDACEKAKQAIAQSEVLRTGVAEGKLKVVSINTNNNEKQWLKSTTLPEWVVNGWDKQQQVEGQEAYVLNSNPLFYFLSPDGTVLMKNEPSLKRMERAVGVVMHSGETDNNTLIKLLFNI